MFNKQDIAILRDMFGEFRNEFKKEFGETIKQNNAILSQEIKRDIRDEMHTVLKQNNLILAQDIKRDIREEMHALLKQNKTEIVREISEFLDSAIIPQISELQEAVGI